MTDQWWSEYSALSESDKNQINPIIEKNIFNNIDSLDVSPAVRKVLRYYCITRDDAEKWMQEDNHQ